MRKIENYEFINYKGEKRKINLNCKNNYQEVISDLSRKILNEEKLKEIKEDRREYIEKNNLKEKYNEEYEFIKDEERIKELVDKNFAKDFLMDNPKDGGNVVLVMGMNPGGGNKIVNSKGTEKKLLFLQYLNEEEEKNIKALGGKIFWPYHKANFKLFEGIKAKAHWEEEGYLTEQDIREMLEFAEKDGINLLEKKLETIKQMLERSKTAEKENVYVLFSDLIWYCDGNQANIESSVTKNITKEEKNGKDTKEKLELQKKKDENFYEIIRKIIKLHIQYHEPKLIVITNAKASHWVEEALRNEEENENRKYKDVVYYNGVPIILASMVSGQRAMDTFSQERLKERIEKLYTK
ncbi:MAG: hypothetical protein J6M60_06635 [Clostridia bacterium]|nr:hypothetical protein [Clostridia bacterium]